MVRRLEQLEDFDFIIEIASESRSSLAKIVELEETSVDGDEMRLIGAAKALLGDDRCDLSGPEAALISGWLLTFEAEVVEFTSRQISKKLAGHRNISNISTTMDSLVSKGQAAGGKREGTTHKHKKFTLSADGIAEAVKLIENYERSKLLSLRVVS